MHHSKLFKRYVIDTSVLVTSPEIFFELRSGVILIPIEVIEEIDNLKTRQDKVGETSSPVSDWTMVLSSRLLQVLALRGYLPDSKTL